MLGWCVFLVFLGSGPVQGNALRDPFTFGPRETSLQVQAPVLSGILFDVTKPLAVFGRKFVTVGGLIEGWQVVEIRQDSIVIQRGDRRQPLFPGDSLPTD